MPARRVARPPLRSTTRHNKGAAQVGAASPYGKRLGQALAFGDARRDAAKEVTGKAEEAEAEEEAPVDEVAPEEGAATTAPAAPDAPPAPSAAPAAESAAAPAKPAATTDAAPAPAASSEAGDTARKLAAGIMSRTQVPAEGEERIATAKAVMIELCAGLISRGAIGVGMATSGCGLDAALLPPVENFMAWIQSTFLDSITMAEHGALLRASCGEVNKLIDALVGGGEVRKFIAALRAGSSSAGAATESAAATPGAAAKRPGSKQRARMQGRATKSPKSAKSSGPARARSAPLVKGPGAALAAATKPRSAKKLVVAHPAVKKPSVPAQRRPAASAPRRRPASAANMGSAVDNALRTAKGEKRRRAEVEEPPPREPAAPESVWKEEPLFESWKHRANAVEEAGAAFRRNTAASLRKIRNAPGNKGIDDLKREMAKLGGAPMRARGGAGATKTDEPQVPASKSERTAEEAAADPEACAGESSPEATEVGAMSAAEDTEAGEGQTDGDRSR